MNQSDRLKAFLTNKKVRQRSLIGVIGSSLTEVNTKLNKNPIEESTITGVAKKLGISFKDVEKIVIGESDPSNKEIAYLKQTVDLMAKNMESLELLNRMLKEENATLKEKLSEKNAVDSTQ